jgi:hypothetical protein
MNADTARAALVDLIARQAEDASLWIPSLTTAAHLQSALHKLHRAAEAYLVATQPHKGGALLKGQP